MLGLCPRPPFLGEIPPDPLLFFYFYKPPAAPAESSLGVSPRPPICLQQDQGLHPWTPNSSTIGPPDLLEFPTGGPLPAGEALAGPGLSFAFRAVRPAQSGASMRASPQTPEPSAGLGVLNPQTPAKLRPIQSLVLASSGSFKRSFTNPLRGQLSAGPGAQPPGPLLFVRPSLRSSASRRALRGLLPEGWPPAGLPADWAAVAQTPVRSHRGPPAGSGGSAP